jgi:hypothetical protein
MAGLELSRKAGRFKGLIKSAGFLCEKARGNHLPFPLQFGTRVVFLGANRITSSQTVADEIKISGAVEAFSIAL